MESTSIAQQACTELVTEFVYWGDYSGSVLQDTSSRHGDDDPSDDNFTDSEGGQSEDEIVSAKWVEFHLQR